MSRCIGRIQHPVSHDHQRTSPKVLDIVPKYAPQGGQKSGATMQAAPKKKILIIDDDERILALLVATLEPVAEYAVFTAMSGNEAFTLARQHKPDLVLLDIMMPDKDGYDICRDLRRSPFTANAKIIMLTAMAQESDKLRSMQAGADDYLTKPFSPTKLLELLEKWLADPPNGRLCLSASKLLVS